MDSATTMTIIIHRGKRVASISSTPVPSSGSRPRMVNGKGVRPSRMQHFPSYYCCNPPRTASNSKRYIRPSLPSNKHHVTIVSPTRLLSSARLALLCPSFPPAMRRAGHPQGPLVNIGPGLLTTTLDSPSSTPAPSHRQLLDRPVPRRAQSRQSHHPHTAIRASQKKRKRPRASLLCWQVGNAASLGVQPRTDAGERQQ